MGRHLSIYLQRRTIHHYDVPYRNTTFVRQIVHVLVCIFRYFANQHDTHTTRVTRKSQLTCTIINLSILVQLVELKIVPFYLHHCLDVTVNQGFTVLYLLISKSEMNETMTELHFCQNQLQFTIATHFGDGIIYRNKRSPQSL